MDGRTGSMAPRSCWGQVEASRCAGTAAVGRKLLLGEAVPLSFQCGGLAVALSGISCRLQPSY